MDILITIPENYEGSEEGKESIYRMFKLLCENMGTDGIECKCIDLKEVD